MRHTTRSALNNLLTEKTKVAECIYWSNRPNVALATQRIFYNAESKRIEFQIKIGNLWWVTDATDSTVFNIEFLGLYDGTAALNFIVASHVLRSVRNGTSTVTALNRLNGGCRITTGATNGNDLTLSTGDGVATTFPFNIDLDPYLHIDFRLPEPDDINDVFFLGSLWADDDNYVGIRYDPAGTYYTANANLLFVTRLGGDETITELGVPVFSVWYRIYTRHRRNNCEIVINEGATIRHTSFVPTVNLAWRVFLETEENAAKHLEISHLDIVQNHQD